MTIHFLATPMTLSPPDALDDAITASRLQMLYESVPAIIVICLMGLLLVCVLLTDTSGMAHLKEWLVYMLSVLGYIGWLWYAFTQGSITADNRRHWQWAHAFGALLLGLGWGTVNSAALVTFTPVLDQSLGLIGIAVAFCAAVFASASYLSFWIILICSQMPLLLRHFEHIHPAQPFPLVTILICLLAAILAHRTQHRLLLRHLRQGATSETLLAEQQAIFQSSTLGIAIVREHRITKANRRLGELLGRRINDLENMPIEAHFVTPDEFESLLQASQNALQSGRLYHGACRMRRADGTEFWAEISGRRLGEEGSTQHLWLLAEAPLRSAGQAIRIAS
ncbi:MAG: PAS domain S-box protein [Proteobacteria bacterium]|nr:PAS domain S-box protein [Pseudomonadota bacterium]HQR03873.1 PAS domain S-box protein [Rhodocyclaceae bacterium]